MHRTKGFDAIYSTSAPITAHLVAGIVKRLTGVPWVAEFRDPWLGNPVTQAGGGRRPWFHRRLQAKVERWIIQSADRIVFVSPTTARLYRRRYPRAAEMVAITNGHDRSEVVACARTTAEPHRYRIVWTGTLDRPAELDALLEAVAALKEKRPTLEDELEIRFYGNVSDACRIDRGPVHEREGSRRDPAVHGACPAAGRPGRHRRCPTRRSSCWVPAPGSNSLFRADRSNTSDKSCQVARRPAAR